MDLGIALAIVGLIISILGFSFKDFILSRDTIRKSIFWLFNKSFFVKIKSVKKYPHFDFNTKQIERAIINCSERYHKVINFKRTGKNNIQILYEGMQAPLYISFQPDIGNEEYEQHEEIEESELPRDLNISMRILGEIEFKYRNDKNNKLYVKLMETIYRLIESENGNVTANYENYNIESTPYDFIEDWTTSKTETSNDASINIGNKVVQINTTRLSSLYDVFKDNRIRYLSTSLFLNLNIRKVGSHQ